MKSKMTKKRLSLTTVYYRLFLFFIVIPILLVLLAALLILNQQFKKQAMENMTRAQETIITELKSDIDVISVRLSHMIYTNNNEILNYAAGTDTSDSGEKYFYQQKLAQAGNLVLEPVKNIVSAGFYMKSGREIYIKSDINRTSDEIRRTSWYQEALKHPNTVCVGHYDTKNLNDLFKGGRSDMLVLVFALAPDVTTDRSQKVEMVMFYQSTDAAGRIKEYNKDYLSGKNKLGITQISDCDGNVIFSTLENNQNGAEIYGGPAYTCVRTPLEFNGTVWYIESYIKNAELTAEYWQVAALVLGTAILVLLFAGFYLRYFLLGLVRPVEEVSRGLRQVEEGNLEIHIAPSGQSEVRAMIHAFNAMARRLKSLIAEYEQRVRSVEKCPSDYFEAMLTGTMTPEEVNRVSREFFMERYVLMCFYMENYPNREKETENVRKLSQSFERHPRFVSRCVLYVESGRIFYVFYRITEEEYGGNLTDMLRQLQKSALRECGVSIAICISTPGFGFGDFMPRLYEIQNKISLRHLKGADAIILLEEKAEETDRLLEMAKDYERLAAALYTADEKNMVQERERLFDTFHDMQQKEAIFCACAAIVAIGSRFSEDNGSFLEVFGQPYDYLEKLGRIEDKRSLKLWLTNYFAWIMDYSASKLRVSETDVMIRAKRYIADYCEDADLSLSRVAEYVGLNEKYFTNRFTRETGENFSSYLTELRMQKACELLKTTSFKIYEIAQMSGYRNVEHFNRMFKKIYHLTPAQYRKTM